MVNIVGVFLICWSLFFNFIILFCKIKVHSTYLSTSMYDYNCNLILVNINSIYFFIVNCDFMHY